jgi:hypothetical protein
VEEENYYIQLKNLFFNLMDDKIQVFIGLNSIDPILKNPYLEESLYKDFSNILNEKLLNFNYNYFIELNDISLYSLDLTNDDLLIDNYILYFINNADLSNKIVKSLLKNALFTTNSLNIDLIEFVEFNEDKIINKQKK